MTTTSDTPSHLDGHDAVDGRSLRPIPQPRPMPLLGNVADLRADGGALGFMRLAREYGPIYRLSLPTGDLIVVSSAALVNELCDETRFDKVVTGPLRGVRDFAGDGLFTAETTEPNWGKAHRILMPAFGPVALREMFGRMRDIAEQLLEKWERFGPDNRIDVGGDATRLTLDTIALCAFSHRFNSMYREDQQPFVGAMVRSLAESGARSTRPALQTRLMVHQRHQYDEDVRFMLEAADGFVAERRRNPLPEGENDILSRIVTAADPRTGERLSDENARFQLVTFLIAGHETTSGLVTFTLYELLKNPELLQRARAEVDEVLGAHRPRLEDLAKLTYLGQVFSESLRLWPPAPAFVVAPLHDTVLGGRYPARTGDAFVVLTPQLHRDPEVWDDPERYDPDRFSFERARELPPNSWRPFGNGQRSCIGRGFALQEATLFLAMLLQRFDLVPADPSYELRIRQALTIKPDGFEMYARRRAVQIVDDAGGQGRPAAEAPVPRRSAANGIPVTVLFGSDAGTAESLAHRIATDARRRGYTPSVGPLDGAVGHLSTTGLVVVVTASYEGLPPDNARAFVGWLGDQREGALEGLRYAVFGCGNKDWARTYQAVPKTVDDGLARCGATRVVPRGEGNARADLFGDFDEWYAGFWAPVDAVFGQTPQEPADAPSMQVRFVIGARETLLRTNEVALGTVVANRTLVAPGVAHDKRHVEIALPDGVTYRAGDYVAVLPLNPPDVVDRALARFGLEYDATAVLQVAEDEATTLPTDVPVTVGELLSAYVELSRPATRRQVDALARATADTAQQSALTALGRDDYPAQVLDRRVSVLELLEQHPSCALSLGSFLQMLTPLAPRRYSISSSPRRDAQHATVTLAVLRAPALSGSGTYEGAASCFLAGTRPGARVAVAVQPSALAFHPPESPATPIVMVCAGSGIAPFRGFLQDRALQSADSGITPGPALLFFGCDDADADYLYRDELESWAADGIVELHPAFSRAGDGVPYVQDRLWQDRARVAEVFRAGAGAVVYVCGDGHRMAPAVHDMCMRIYRDVAGCGEDEAQAWLERMAREQSRYLTDVFE